MMTLVYILFGAFILFMVVGFISKNRNPKAAVVSYGIGIASLIACLLVALLLA